MSFFQKYRSSITVIAVCFFLSGMSGLIYQVLWTKMLGLIFGHTGLAISTVVASFLAGLALGSYLIGKMTDGDNNIFKRNTPSGYDWRLFAYAAAELVIGIFSLLTPWLFTGVELIYSQFIHLPFMAVNLIRFILCGVVLLLPTMAMGATLPIISKYLISSEKEVGPKLGFIYSINTAGSVLGTLLAGFILIPSIGNSASLQLAAVINIGIALFMFSYSKGAEELGEPEEQTKEGEQTTEEIPDKIRESDRKTEKGLIPLFAVVFAISGFSSLVYELSWNRALAMAIGSSTYAFSSMLAVFLLGTALGSYIFSSLAKKIDFSFKSFAVIQLCIAVSSFLCSILLGYLPIIFAKILPYVALSYNLVIITDFFLCFLAMIIPTIFIGMSFPLAGKLYLDNISKLGSSIGNIYAINTIGSVSGSFLTGFLFMPTFGARNAILIGVSLNILAALILIVKTEKITLKKIAWMVSVAAIAVAIYLTPPWDYNLMTLGLFRHVHKDITLNKINKNAKILYYKDGLSCTVSVRKDGDQLSLQVNGKTDASNSSDMGTQFLVGALPTFYVDNPQKAYLIGLGSGVTARAALLDKSIQKLDCAEIEPVMKDAATFFNQYNGNILSNPRFIFHEADGRSLLKFSKEKYDIIISEPSNPWVAGVASLFTKEFYELSKSKLTPDGVMCIWLQLYAISPEDVKMIINTISSVFPEYHLWLANNLVDCLLVCSEKPLDFKMEKYKKMYKEKDFAEMSATSPMIESMIKSIDSIFAYYINTKKGFDLLNGYKKINTDDLLTLEYSAPLTLYRSSINTNVVGIQAFKEEFKHTTEIQYSPQYYINSFLFLNQTQPQLTQHYMNEGIKRYPQNSELNSLLIQFYEQTGKFHESNKLIEKNIASSNNKNYFLALKALILARRGDINQADRYYEKIYNEGKLESDFIYPYLKNLLALKKYDRLLSIIKEQEKQNLVYMDIFLPLQFSAQTALKRYNEAEITALKLEKTKCSEEILIKLSDFYIAIGNKEKALHTAMRNYAESNHSVKASESLIKIFIALERYYDAKSIAIDTIARDPYNHYLNKVILKY